MSNLPNASDDRCVHDLVRNQCAICKQPKRSVNKPEPFDVDELPSKPFEAQFRSRCPGCDGQIYEGDQIVMFHSKAYHDDCVS